jgi:peroxiredoxin
MHLLRTLVASFLSIGLVPAQGAGDAAQDPVAAIRALYTELQAKRTKSDADIASMMDKAKRAQGTERAKIMDQAERARIEGKAPMGTFLDAFRGLDWAKLDPKTDGELMREGLSATAGDLTHPEKAVQAGRMMVELFAEDPVLPFVRSRLLPKALLATGNADEAARVLRDAVPVVKQAEKVNTLLLLGDLTAVRGDFAGAKQVYAEIEQLGDKAGSQLAAARTAIIGQPAPEIDSSTWIGGEPAKLSSLKGKVVLLGFWQSWSPTCRASTVHWNKLHDEFVAQGLQCLGATRIVGHGYLPADEAQLLKGGLGKQGMVPDDFVGLVRQFHTNIRIHYPFVITKEEDFKNYGVLPLPTVVLIDREGRVALVSTQHDGEPLVKFGVQHLLAKTE